MSTSSAIRRLRKRIELPPEESAKLELNNAYTKMCVELMEQHTCTTPKFCNISQMISFSGSKQGHKYWANIAW